MSLSNPVELSKTAPVAVRYAVRASVAIRMRVVPDGHDQREISFDYNLRDFFCALTTINDADGLS